jgi:hypothetical protein
MQSVGFALVLTYGEPSSWSAIDGKLRGLEYSWTPLKLETVLIKIELNKPFLLVCRFFDTPHENVRDLFGAHAVQNKKKSIFNLWVDFSLFLS